ncbi:MAG: two-component sensor histidine kinase [Treponema sp.]|jgi:signal transduction histidine kinase|nr:two-component sensor histidine kinase [Treponema sp.]
MINLKSRLILTYALFVSAALMVVTISINQCTGTLFESLVRETIKERGQEIVRSVADIYNPRINGFDVITMEAIGMHFVHEGYIITVESPEGETLWDARSMDMQHCVAVLNDITSRMEERHQIQGSLQYTAYPLLYQNTTIGTLTIESYGPFFYSEGESRFLSGVNRLLFIAGLVFTVLSVFISTFLAAAIAKPILKASEAAHCIAGGNRNIRVFDGYKTKELQELACSINTLAKELAEGERRQKQLTSDIAHELRTPLTCLQGNVEAMIDGIWEPTTERLMSCHEEITRLSRLVQDINLLTNLEWEHLTLHKTSFDLAKLLQLVGEQFQSPAYEKGLAIILRLTPSLIVADYDRLKQVFINLLANGIKYTDAGAVTITILPIPLGWEVGIADTGAGISERDLPHIFERFYRSDKSRNRGTGGAGIGLTIAQAIVTAHGGTISVTSEPGSGSVFRVALAAEG